MIILHYVPTIDIMSGGIGSYIQLLAKDLGKLVELHIVTHRSSNELVIKNCQIHYISNKIISYYSIKKEFERLLDNINPTLVHVNSCWNPLTVLIQNWSQDKGYKVILTPHGMLEPWILNRHYWTRKLPAMLLYQKKAIITADLIHATAESEKENILKLNLNNKVKIVPNGVDVDSVLMKNNWERKYKILFLSRIHIKKGIEFLIEAVSHLKEELKDYEVIVAGEGDMNYINTLKSKCLELKVDKIFSFIGGVYGNRKWNLFREADIFILPTYSENFGIVVAESLASGTPVITTKGTPWEELDKFDCGWWIDIGITPLVNALSSFLKTSDSKLNYMGNNGRKLIENKYSTIKIANEMYILYEELVKDE